MVGKYLITAFKHFHSSTTLQTKIAWKKAYDILANTLMHREQQLLDSFDGWTTWRPFRLVEKVPNGKDICYFLIESADKLLMPTFFPGQYVSERVDIPGRPYKQIRRYALYNSPHSEYYEIAAQRDLGGFGSQYVDTATHYTAPVPGIVSSHLAGEILAGDSLEQCHPTGQFYVDTSNLSEELIVLLSAGIGAAPLLSILHYVVE